MKLRRKRSPLWLRIPVLLLCYLLLWPLVRILELFDKWPRMISRAMAKSTDEFEGYSPDAHDVFVGSYFKTGTNWTMQIALQIAWRGNAQFEHVHDLIPWIEFPAKMRYAVSIDEADWRVSPTQLRVIKTHLPFSKLGYSSAAKYIWVVRDPKDVFVSSYHFTRKVMLGPLMPSVHRWLDVYLSEDTFLGSWAEHLQGGWQRRNEPNVLFLTFESMKEDLPAVVRQIAQFMGVALSDSEFAEVVRQSSYEYMKSIGHKFDPVGLSPPWAQPTGAMMRKGKSGAAGELLTFEDQQRIDSYWQTELAKLESDYPYAEAFVVANEKAAVSGASE